MLFHWYCPREMPINDPHSETQWNIFLLYSVIKAERLMVERTHTEKLAPVGLLTFVNLCLSLCLSVSHCVFNLV